MPESSPLQPEQKVGAGRFTLVQSLGRGGMGEVWLAQDERLHEPVALKFLPPEVRADPVALDDLRRETARSHKLTHPNIVRIHDLHEEQGGMAFIAMEYVDGPTLAGLRLEQPERVLSWEFLRPLVQQLCSALDYAHGEKVIHRDLKPANVMVDDKGRLKLADFGIAATVSDSVSRVSGRHATSGTLPYMSPQQLAGKHPQVADDIYALGATLYELLTSKPPFYMGDLTHQVLHEPPEPPDERLAALGIANAIPPDGAALIMACLAKEPAQRPQSARAVAGWIGLEVVSKPSLQSLTSEVFGKAESGESVGPLEAGDATPPPPRSRRNLLLAGVAAAVLVLVALSGWYWGIHPRAKRNRLVPEQTVASETTAATAAVNVATASAGVTSGNEAISKAESWEQWHERTSGSATHDIPAPTVSTPAALEPGFVSLFNGHDLSGWKGDLRFWSVEDRCIVGDGGRARVPNPCMYLVWKDGTVRDFELRLTYKLVRGNSGVQYRSRELGNWQIAGYQAEIADASNGRTGGLYDQNTPRSRNSSFLADCGEKVVWGTDGRKQVVGSTGTREELQATIRHGDWNDYAIIARGNHLVHQINGKVMIEASDNDPSYHSFSGVVALQLIPVFRGETTRVLFRNIRVQHLAGAGVTNAGGPATRLDWRPLFDGKTLSGWTTPNAPNNGGWRVTPDGALVSQGPTSHLFSPQAYTNLEFKAEIKLSPRANGGMFFRAERYPVKGYEAQAYNGNVGMKTGSLYRFAAASETVASDEMWFTQHVIAIGNRIVIRVNNRIVVDYTDLRHTYSSGHLAVQHWVPPVNSTTSYRNVMVKPLPEDEALAWAEARKDMPDLAR